MDQHQAHPGLNPALSAGLATTSGDGCRLLVRLTPKSARDAIDGLGADADGRPHLKARVRAAPEKGKANKALLGLLAKELGVPAASLGIVSGQTSRLKTVRIEGDTALVAARLGEVLRARGP